MKVKQNLEYFLNLWSQPTMVYVLFIGDSSTDPVDSEKSEDPRTCPIEPGKCTYIEIEKIKKGLGLGIVGGSDTQLVSTRLFVITVLIA